MTNERADAESKTAVVPGDASSNEDPVETAFEKMAAFQREMMDLQRMMAVLHHRMMDLDHRMMDLHDGRAALQREMMDLHDGIRELHRRMAALQREMTDLQRGIQEHEDVHYNRFWASPDHLAAIGAAAIYAKAFLETLAKRHADALEDLVETRIRRKGKPDEYRIGVDADSVATIAITEDTPDEARLALLDLDVTADEVRGKLLRWDSSASAWRPADDR
jgi:chromosome segregation ATPase